MKAYVLNNVLKLNFPKSLRREFFVAEIFAIYTNGSTFFFNADKSYFD